MVLNMGREDLVSGKEFAKRLSEMKEGVDYIDLEKRYGQLNEITELNERWIAWNGHVSNEHGIIWCIIKENKPGYYPMMGNPGKLQAPWYLAMFEHFTNEKGEIDMVLANERADKLARKWNHENGFSDEDIMQIMASSIRATYD